MEIEKIVLNIRKDEKLLLMRNVDLYIYTEKRKYHYTRQLPKVSVMLAFREMIDKIYHFLQKEEENERVKDKSTPNEKDRKPEEAPSPDSSSQGAVEKGEGVGNEET